MTELVALIRRVSDLFRRQKSFPDVSRSSEVVDLHFSVAALFYRLLAHFLPRKFVTPVCNQDDQVLIVE